MLNLAAIIHVRNHIASITNIIFKERMKNKTYFVNKIIFNRHIWVAKAIDRPADTNTPILDLSKEQITPLPKIVLKSKALSTFASSITSSAILSSIVLLFMMICECFTVDTVPSSSFTLFVRISLLVESSLIPLGEFQDWSILEVAVKLPWSRSLLISAYFKLIQSSILPRFQKNMI